MSNGDVSTFWNPHRKSSHCIDWWCSLLDADVESLAKIQGPGSVLISFCRGYFPLNEKAGFGCCNPGWILKEGWCTRLKWEVLLGLLDPGACGTSAAGFHDARSGRVPARVWVLSGADPVRTPLQGKRGENPGGSAARGGGRASRLSCMYVCMYVCMYIYIYIYIWVVYKVAYWVELRSTQTKPLWKVWPDI